MIPFFATSPISKSLTRQTYSHNNRATAIPAWSEITIVFNPATSLHLLHPFTHPSLPRLICALLVFLLCQCRPPIRTPLLGFFPLGLDPALLYSPVTVAQRSPFTPSTSRHEVGHSRNHGSIPSHVPARLRLNRITRGLTSPARARPLTPTGSLLGPGQAVSRTLKGSTLYTVQPLNGIGHGRDRSARADSDSLKSSWSRPTRC